MLLQTKRLVIREWTHGYAGIPCFVKEDGSVTLDPADLGLEPRPMEGASCNLDGSGC